MKVDNYAKFFETLDKTMPIDEYEKYMDEDAVFKDPFHEVKGIKNIFGIFQKMYKNLDEPKFTIDEVLQKENIAYIRWYFSYRFKNQDKKEGFYGVSRVEFGENSKVISHEDYWDSSENVYEKIPILSSIIRLVKNKIKE